MWKKILLVLASLLVIILFLFFLVFFPIRKESVTYEIDEKNIIAHLTFSKTVINGKCFYKDMEVAIENQSCELTIPNAQVTITVKTPWNKKDYVINPAIDEVIGFTTEESLVYLVVGEKKKVGLSVDRLGNPNITGEFISQNPEVVAIEDGKLVGKQAGRTKVSVKVSDIVREIEVIVTDLVTMPILQQKKSYLPCGIYSQEQNELLDKYLEYKINRKGYQTRAGVVEALRFLTLQFPYKLTYFFENGRLNNNTGGAYVDGEGRWYHKGLYLNAYKFQEIIKRGYGPATWGCPLLNWQDEAWFVPGVRYANGLDCSGFITWAMYNGGFDPGDTGAGDNYWTDDDLSDLGEHIPITRELLESNTIKAGDIIATDGHIAMVGGIKDGVVYVAESTTYWEGVVMYPYTYDELLATDKLTYVINMDDYYQKDGNYTIYWE